MDRYEVYTANQVTSVILVLEWIVDEVVDDKLENDEKAEGEGKVLDLLGLVDRDKGEDSCCHGETQQAE